MDVRLIERAKNNQNLPSPRIELHDTNQYLMGPLARHNEPRDLRIA